MKKISYLFVLQFCWFAVVPVQSSAQSAIQQFDTRVLTDFSEHRTPPQTSAFMFISKYNNLVNAAVPVGLLAGGIIGNDKGMRQNSLYVASSSAVNLIATMLVKQLVKRQRPFFATVKINAVYQPAGYSFPSGHSSSAFTTATALSQAYPKWYVIAPSYLWAGAIGYSRMYLGVHYPSDVAAGAILGAGTAVSMRFLKAD
jgi:membrane-associated phospholipid phosphatase